MRLKEEKTLIKLQVISLMLILFSTVMIQIADYQISKHNNTINTKILELSNLLQVQSEYKTNANFYTLMISILGKNISIDIDKGIFTSPWIDKESKKSIHGLMNDSISKKEFLENQIIIYKQRYKELFEKYNNQVIEFEEFRKKDTIWQFIRNFVFVPIQFFFILILALGYIHIFINISRRIQNYNKR